MTLDLVTAPTNPMLSTAEANAHLRVDIDTEDSLVDRWVTAAKDRVENHVNRALITQTWDQILPAFPRCPSKIQLPKAPLQSVTSITYIDLAGDSQVWDSANYDVFIFSGPQAEPGFIVPAHNVSWPSVRAVPNAVTIRFVAGYGDDAADCPEAIREGLALWLGSMFANREDDVVGTIAQKMPNGAASLLGPYRIEL